MLAKHMYPYVSQCTSDEEPFLRTVDPAIAYVLTEKNAQIGVVTARKVKCLDYSLTIVVDHYRN